MQKSVTLKNKTKPTAKLTETSTGLVPIQVFIIRKKKDENNLNPVKQNLKTM